MVTVTVTLRVELPEELAAVRVKVVVVVGLTEVLEPATAPTPWSMETEVAPVKFQASTDDPPAVMFEGEAVKEPITGTGNADTVTVTLAVALPEVFVAVSV